MTNINNKVFWITGASSGIGEAIVYELAKQNIKLIISARRQNVLEEVKERCLKASQENINIIPLDLGETDTLQDKAKEALALFGKVDIVIHCGGISQRSMAIDTILEVDQKVMQINYFGTIALTKAILPSMIDNGYGHFVTISSLTGKFGAPYRSGYAASKHALHGFFDSLRAELWKQNILVTLVCPGFIKTNISMNAVTEKGKILNEMDEAQSNGMPADVCAKKIIRGIERQKNELLIGNKEILGVYLKRFVPSIFAKIIRKAKVR